MGSGINQLFHTADGVTDPLRKPGEGRASVLWDVHLIDADMGIFPQFRDAAFIEYDHGMPVGPGPDAVSHCKIHPSGSLCPPGGVLL